MDNAECADAVLAVKKLMVLENYYWTIWCIMGLREADETNPNAFHWIVAKGRTGMNQLHIQKFGSFAQI